MVITYYGHEYARLQFGDAVIAVNPVSKEASSATARFGADIALVSANDSFHNGTEQVVGGGRETFVIRGPGEYEVKEVVIKGFAVPPKEDGVQRTVYF